MLDLETLMFGIKINFRIRIPALKQNRYQFTHIVSLPINEPKFIIVPNWFITKDVHYFIDKCNRVHKYFICENSISAKYLPRRLRNARPKTLGNKKS